MRLPPGRGDIPDADGVVGVAVSAHMGGHRVAGCPTRWLLGVLVVLLGLVSVGSALAAEVPVAGAIEVVSQADPGPNDPGRCIAVTFLRFPAIQGATRYSAVVDNVVLGHQLRGPAVPGCISASGLQSSVVPGRWGSPPVGAWLVFDGCGLRRCGGGRRGARHVGELDRDVPGENWISGAVRDGQAKGVAGVRVSVGARTVATDAFGGYRVKVEDGRYAVSAPGPYCVKGLPGCKRAKTVKVPPAQTVDFAAPGEHQLTGTVRESDCGETSCTRARAVGGRRCAGDAEGRWRAR